MRHEEWIRKEKTLTYTEWPGILLAWFDQNKRELPWRETKPRDPYHVWVSEIMLQQTRTEAVKPYFTSWMERFPTIEALAEADEAEYFTSGRASATTAAPEICTKRLCS